MQYCINLCDYEINKIFVKNFLCDLLKFSTQKYSSNIIEKCMDCCDEETKELICQKYCDKNLVEKLLFDLYGNYVLQKVISLSKEPLTTKYLEMIGPLMKNLNNISFGQKLYNRLIISFPNLSTYVGLGAEPQKNKKFKNKKKNNNNINNKNINNNGNNMNMNEFVNNIYVNNSYNMNNINGNVNNNNSQILMMPGINNSNYFIPYQISNNNNSINNPINKSNIPLQNLLNNNNNFAMNNNIANSNMNNLLQFQQAMNRNNNIEYKNNYYNINQ